MGLRTCIMIIPMPKKMPTTTNGQGMSPPTMPMASVAISPACGAESWRLPKPNAVFQQVERPVHDQAGDDHGDQFGHLNLARRATQDVADFEVLQEFAGDR